MKEEGEREGRSEASYPVAEYPEEVEKDES